MKVSQADIVIVPGFGGAADEAHWQRRWARQISTARIIDPAAPMAGARDKRLGEIVLAVEEARRPVVLVGHSLGAVLIAHAAPLFAPGRVAGAFLVAPSDWERPNLIPERPDHDFAPIPREKLPFPSQVVASRNDPYCDFEVAQALAAAWGAQLIDAGEAGHINVESGQGPWPEGLTAFALFMKTLTA